MNRVSDSNIFNWEFTKDDDGTFKVSDTNRFPVLYFPLMNNFGLKSFVTPTLKGDICSSFHNYLTTPTVTEEIHRTISSRNFWINIKNEEPWSATGESLSQKADIWNNTKDRYSIEGKIGAFSTKRLNNKTGLEVSITVFVPETDDLVEILKITVKNKSSKELSFNGTYAIPVFGRSADNFRDHRQVTTMFQENFIEENGVRIKPKIVHDENGHSKNTKNYIVLGFDQEKNALEDIWVRLHDFIGIGGSLDNPEAIYKKINAPITNPTELHGHEAIAAFRFKEKTLKPNEKFEYIIVQGISDTENDIKKWTHKFGEIEKVNNYLTETLNFWQKTINNVDIKTGDYNFNNWVKWVSYQVKCRQVYGNSYLPDFGYGRGGRGWRDLWQDLLSIFLVDPKSAKTEMLNNFQGIRIDGSNATIIGENPGEFKADRNDIPRVWCDHGAWPVFILNFYLNQTGDYNILFNEISYWKDQYTHRSKEQDKEWSESRGNSQLNFNGEIYTGSLFEHILLQQLSAFFNVGEHNILLLEGGDWNDTLDMARDQGESVCFYNFYSYNLKTLSEILSHIKNSGVEQIELLEDMLVLLDRLPGQEKVDYDSPQSKQLKLQTYFQNVKHKVSGQKKAVPIDSLIYDLETKANHIANIIRTNEWITLKNNSQFFNGHYDNLGNRLGGDFKNGVQMDLTSQVMPILCNISDKYQTSEAYTSIRKILKDKEKFGLKLCTEFKEIDLNIGRITGFVYGNKEHGSKWMQQNIMLAYGLYKQGFVKEGHAVLNDVFKLCNDTEKAQLFPGMPSYFDNQDKGRYAYLTGSSSWFLLTLTTQVFGVRGEKGDLCIEPKLMKEQFNTDGVALICCNFKKYRLKIEFRNDEKLEFGDYKISKVEINNAEVLTKNTNNQKVLIKNNIVNKMYSNKENKIIVTLKNDNNY